MCKSAAKDFEARHVDELEAKLDLQKSGPPSTSNFQCQITHALDSFTTANLTGDDETRRVDNSVYTYISASNC